MLKISNVLVILFLIFSFTYSIAENYKVDDKVKDQFIFNKKFKIDLPQGEWVIADKSAFEYYGIFAKEYILLKLEDIR